VHMWTYWKEKILLPMHGIQSQFLGLPVIS
jgi:hypothetical protein